MPNRESGEIAEKWIYTLITRNANEVVTQIHNDEDNKGRMALFLPFKMSNKWVEGELTEEQYRKTLAFEMPSEELNYHPVLTLRSPKDRPEINSRPIMGIAKKTVCAWGDEPGLKKWRTDKLSAKHFCVL